GGTDNVGNLWIESSVTFSNQITNIISRKSSTMGIRIGDSQLIFNNAIVDSNGSYGIYIEGNRPSDITIRNSFIQDNNGAGLQAINNSTYREVSNCQIRRNNGWGIGTDNGTLPQRFQGNTITNNANGGIYNNSSSLTAADLQYVGNTVTDHPTDDGILSTAARFIDNIIQRNKYPIGMWARLGNIYTDNSGVDGNVISGNTYNAISLRGSNSPALLDTLKNVFPLGIPSKTYVAIQDLYVNGGTTLLVQPGVIVKFAGYFSFQVYGTLLANGTPANPIIFTSLHDSTVGGKTALATDYAPPAPGDWYYIGFRSGSGASIVRYCQFKYGGRDNQQTIYLDVNLNTLTFSNNLVRKSMAGGIFLNNTAVTIDSTTVDSCSYHGIRANGNANNNLILRYSKINNNGNYGVWIQNGSKLSVLLNCDISRNTYSGVYVENNSVPLSVIGNTVNNNGDHGMYFISRNDAIDSLLTIAGNKIRNNGLAGLFSSRAYISDDSITGNRYGIGLVGQTSLAATGTANGNVFQNNVVTGNRFSTFVMEGTIFGKIGYSFLPGDTNKVIAVRGDAFVQSGSTLTIAPGTVVKFPVEYGNGRLEAQGVLTSEGTTNKKVVFTSWKDDSYGGDSNADSNATVPANGNWDMVWLNGAGSNTSHIFNTIIRFGGRSNNSNLRLDGNSAPIDSSFISFGSANGILMYSASPTITGCEIHSNNSAGINMQNSSNPVINFNIIRDNLTYGIYHNTSNTINAINNYWGASSGPLVNQGADQNLTGTGNRIYIAAGVVTYRPFLTSRTGVLLGDVSLNGTITSFDASLILRHLAATLSPALTSTQLAAADVTGDATVSALDASYILRYVTGLITGFPGLGKVVTNSIAASAFEFKTQTGSSPDEVRLVLALKKTVPIFAIELQLSFDSTLVSVAEINKTTFSDKMMIESNIKSDRATIVMAAMYPLTEAGDAVNAIFKIKNQAKGMGTIRVERFILNETNLTDEAKREAGTLKTTEQIPTEFSLGQNYPNPFNPSTTIAYQVPTTSTVTIKIYDVLGQEVRSLVNAEQKPGVYTAVWDGRNAFGQTVATNVYYYRIEATSADNQRFVQVKKMLLLK
ncbi:MAG: right-handed parallel beta-helix repeat-containing protein, partial [Ignavibacteriales bacterium]|nr:right-handed parallel beta-helix repeat-containing protein [Ignavibacteriales bacterium]